MYPLKDYTKSEIQDIAKYSSGGSGVSSTINDDKDKVKDLDTSSFDDIICTSSANNYNIDSHFFTLSSRSLANIGVQIRNAVATTSVQTDSNNLSHLPTKHIACSLGIRP
jgi:hypothetical protein